MEHSIRKERVLRELACIAFASATDYLQIRDGALLVQDTGALTPEAAAAVAAVERGSGGLKIKFYDKLKALELLGKYLALFDGTVADTGEEGLLESLLLASGEEVRSHEIPELQSQAASGAELVESQDPAGV